MRTGAGICLAALTALAASAALAVPPCAADRVDLIWAGGSASFAVEVADDAAERAKGLMHRDSMAAGSGMLFGL